MKNIILNIVRSFVFVILFVFGVGSSVYGQNFIQLFDYAGDDSYETTYQTELQTAADELVATFPTEFQSDFKVYDFGFYLHQEDYDGFGYPEEFTKVIREQVNSEYYLVFGRQTDQSGVNKKIFVDLKLPNDLFECLGEDFLITLQNEIKFTSNQGPGNAYANMEMAVEETAEIIASVITCCDDGNRSNDCPLCVFEEDQIVRKLKLKNYVEIDHSGFNITVDNYVVTGLTFDVSIPNGDGGFTSRTINYLNEINEYKATDPDNVFSQIDYLVDKCELEAQQPAPIFDYAYGEHTIVYNDNGNYRFFFKINATIGSGSRSGERAVFALAPFLIKRAILGGVNVAVGLIMETAFTKWINGYESYGTAWDNLEINYWNVFLDFAEGAIAPNIPIYVQFGLNVFRGSILYVLDVGISGFWFEEFILISAEGGAQVAFFNIIIHSATYVGGRAGAFGRIWLKKNPQVFNNFKKSSAQVINKFVGDLTTPTPNGGLSSVFNRVNLFVKHFSAWKGLINSSIRTSAAWLKRANAWLNQGGEFSSAGTGQLNHKGKKILKIKDEQLQPDKYDFDPLTNKPKPGGTPIGDPANGYQVFKHGDELSVRRVPDKSGYTQSEVAFLTQNGDAHTLARHGHDVTDAALIKRATEHIAPDGAPNSAPGGGVATKFADQDAVIDAVNNIKPGTDAFDARVLDPESGNWIVEAPGYYGYGFKNNGTGGPQLMSKVTAIFEEVSSGFFELITMYPNK